MSKIRLVGISAIALLAVCASQVRAEDVSTKKLSIKDNANVTKRQVQVQSSDVGVQLSEADDPGANGATIHVYSATDDFCKLLPAGPEWTTNGKQWKYVNKITKNSAQVADGKLKVKIKSGVSYSLADNGTQGAVNVQVQFGSGTKYCMRCSSPTKDDAKTYSAKSCAATACDPELSVCDPFSTTTTSTSTTTTNPPVLPGVVLKAVLAKTTGAFNYNLVVGIPGSDAACNSAFAGSTTCTFADLEAAEAAGDLNGIKDPSNNSVTSFWAIDSTHANNTQCFQSIHWNYATAHTGVFAEVASLNNATGALGPSSGGVCASQSWVGCCM